MAESADACYHGLKRLFNDLMAHEANIEITPGFEHRSRGFKIVFRKFQPVRRFVVQSGTCEDFYVFYHTVNWLRSSCD
jgi:hypothetical protein